MKKLIEALRVIKEECLRRGDCKHCPLSSGDISTKCRVTDNTPDMWKINDEVQKALL